MYVITGGGSGIGRALAMELAQQSKAVLVVGRREQQLRETAQSSEYINYVCADLSKEQGRQKLLHFLKQRPIKALIHNAGTIEPIAAIEKISLAQWQQVFAINVEAPLCLTSALRAQLNGGKVLNIGTAVAHFPVKGWAPYCVSKAALFMLMRCWQEEFPEIAFASVMPGIIDTPMQAYIRQTDGMNQDKAQFFINMHEQHRLVTPQTVALFISWILSLARTEFSAQEWDIYEKNHHSQWLIPPHQVPEWGDLV